MKICLDIDWYHRRLCLHEPFFATVRMAFTVDGVKMEGEAMNLTLPADRVATGSLSITDKFGNPAKVDGVPVWAASDPSKLLVEASADGLTAKVSPVGPLGTSQVTVAADADLGEGVKPLTGIADVEVIAGEAAVLDINFAVE